MKLEKNLRKALAKSRVRILNSVLLCVFSTLAYGNFEVSTVDVKAIKHLPAPTFNKSKNAFGYKKIKNQYIIQLKQPSLVKHLTQQTGLEFTGKNTNRHWQKSSGALSYQKRLVRQQHKFISKVNLLQPRIEIFKQFDVLINGIAVNATSQQVAVIAKLPEVNKVYPVHLYYANLDRSHEVIRTNLAWEKVGGRSIAGKNIKIAIIDTGIRNTNPLFDDAGLSEPEFSPNEYFIDQPDYCRSEQGDPQFCNNKIILARWINPAEHGMEIYEGEYQSPLDFNGHGSHVAGIASGTPIEVTVDQQIQSISGVAPASYLMIYKALYVDAFGNAAGSDTMLLEALETAVKDGADIINNSWGALGQSPEQSIFRAAITNAEAAGVVVVNAAGNDLHAGGGDTINCPACIESGLAVANTTHGRFFGNEITVNGQTFMGYQGELSKLTVDQELTLHTIDTMDSLNSDACTVNLGENVFDGGVILAEYRYNCTFEEIANRIKKAGGEMVIITPAGSFGMGTYEPLLPLYFEELAIPILGVSRDTGFKLAELAYTNRNIAHISADITRGVESQFSDKQHPFSSTGPNRSPYILKPDIAAPGTNILSAYSPDIYQAGSPPLAFSRQTQLKVTSHTNSDSTFALLTGTSMASPHIAGTAALLKQAHPDWDAKQIKSALTSTANTQVLIGYDQANAFGIGAGRVDVANAIDAALTFTKVSFTDNACISECSFNNIVQNTLDAGSQWDVSVVFDDNLTTGKVSIEELLLSAKGDSGDQLAFTLTVDSSRAAIGEWVFGQVLFQQNGYTKQHLPIAIFTNDTSDSGVLNVSASRVGQLNTSPITINTHVRNINFSSNESLTLTMKVPDNTSLIEASESVTINQGVTHHINYNPATHQLVWEGQLDQGKMQLVPVSPWDNTTLASLGVEPIACSEGCDYFNTYIGFEFIYNGQSYQDLTISDNGFIVPGNIDFSFWSALFNQSFPQAKPLNNVIAPLWAEFDLADPLDPDDMGGGELRAAIRMIDNINYLIIEWLNVKQQVSEFESDTVDDSYSFQLIIEEHSDNIWFNYLKLASLPPAATIGAENYDGRIGTVNYFDGEGVGLPLPIEGEGYTLKLEYQREGKVEVKYDVSLSHNQNFTIVDSTRTDEESSLLIDVLANDEQKNQITAVASLAVNHQVYNAYRNLPVAISGGIDPTTLTLVTMPEQGTATVDNNGIVKYQPEENFFGKDKFSYKVADQAGNYSQPTKVSIVVNNINDAPLINTVKANNALSQQKVIVTVDAIDVDNDPLTFQWQQTKGPIVQFTQRTNKIEFTAPHVNTLTTISFLVTAQDGNSISESKSVDIIINKHRNKGGSMLYLVLVLFALLALKLELNARSKHKNH